MGERGLLFPGPRCTSRRRKLARICCCKSNWDAGRYTCRPQDGDERPSFFGTEYQSPGRNEPSENCRYIIQHGTFGRPMNNDRSFSLPYPLRPQPYGPFEVCPFRAGSIFEQTGTHRKIMRLGAIYRSQ